MNRQKISSALFLLAASLVLLGAAFLNGFPLVYSDTGTYISSGFTLETPWDRPLLYGLFIRLFSLNGLTLWTVALAQSFIVVWLLNLCFKNFTRARFPERLTFFSSLFLAVFTGLSWVSSFLIADIFTPVTILSLLLILYSRDLSRIQLILLYLVALLSMGMHISHAGLSIFLVFSLSIRYWWRNKRGKANLLIIRRLPVVLIIPVIAYISMGSAVGKARHIFLMARLSEMGVLKTYLDENCAAGNLNICRYRDSLPGNSGVFLWEPASPLHREGGRDAVKKEYNTILHNIFTSPHYLSLYAKGCFTGTYRQCLAFNPGEGLFAYDSSSTVNAAVHQYFPREEKMYLGSKQEKQQLASIDAFNLVSMPAIVLSIILLLIWLLLTTKKPGMMRELILFVTAAILFQHFFCAATATIAQRYGCRVIWLFPFLLLLLLASGEWRSITSGLRK